MAIGAHDSPPKAQPWVLTVRHPSCPAARLLGCSFTQESRAAHRRALTTPGLLLSFLFPALKLFPSIMY